jgi:hypothetical protein
VAVTTPDQYQIPERRDGVGGPQREKAMSDDLLVRVVVLIVVVVDLEVIQVAAHFALFDT